MRTVQETRIDTHVYLPASLYEHLRKTAARDHRSVNSLMVKILADWRNGHDVIAKSQRDK